jgi:hypothetical protein
MLSIIVFRRNLAQCQGVIFQVVRCSPRWRGLCYARAYQSPEFNLPLYSLGICCLDIGIERIWLPVIVNEVPEVELLCFESLVVCEVGNSFLWHIDEMLGTVGP